MDAIDSDSVWVAKTPVLRKLSDFESITGRLEAGGRALDAYELESKAGDNVRLRLTSDDFQVVGFVVLVSAATNGGGAPPREPFVRTVPGGTAGTSGSVEAQPPVTLPVAGVYRVVVTSLDNHARRQAASSGEYRMTLLVDTASTPSLSGPESQKGPRFSAWESDGR